MSNLPFQELLIASHNEGKLREFELLCQNFGVRVHSAAQFGLIEPEETGITFEENAAIKAKAAAQATGLVALADDSGLCIDALNGRPGVYTANWAIQKDGKRDFAVAMARIEEELRLVGAITPEQRTCRFVCCLCLAWPDHGEAKGEKIHFFRGEIEGRIVSSPCGQGGFGYDPIFQPLGFEKTFAQMSAEEKHGAVGQNGQALSHRARALQLFRQAVLKNFLL